MYIEFIIGTIARPNHLLTILSSIKTQTDGTCKCLVVKKNDTDNEYQNIISFCKENLFDERLRYIILNNEISDKYTGEYNLYPNFQYGLEHSNTDCDWVIMTNDDNYYSPNTVKIIRNTIEKNPDVKLIYFDMLYNSDMIDSTGKWVESYQYNKTNLNFGFNDIGCFVYKREFAKNIKFKENIFPEADYYFLKEYMEKYCKNENEIIKINKALFIHN